MGFVPFALIMSPDHSCFDRR